MPSPPPTPPSPFIPVPGWDRDFPWAWAGTTGRPPGLMQPDFGLFAGSPTREVLDNWMRLLAGTPFHAAAHSRQVHGPTVRVHGPLPEGLLVAGEGDGHATRAPGVLLTVALADCVPVFMLDPARRAVALLHAGWRGVAAGIVASGVSVLRQRFAAEPGDLVVHLGPAICGECYEVGPEVFAALDEEVPDGPRPMDLRSVIRSRAAALGVDPDRISVSDECTRCGDGRLFSHRGGDRGRQIACLGIQGGPPLQASGGGIHGVE